MDIKYLIMGAGISGLSFANFIKSKDYLILEKAKESGGYCKTIKQDGFTWDYSGHFLHFKNKNMEKFVLSIIDDKVLNVLKNTKIKYKDKLVDFPFQANIHQLNIREWLECLYYLFTKKEREKYLNFKDMLLGKFGKGICTKFLFPYNEKLYACNLNELDVDAIGRFFPYIEKKDIIKNAFKKNVKSYNDYFFYPKNGIGKLIEALEKKLDKSKILLDERIVKIDKIKKEAITNKGRKIKYKYLISTISLPSLLDLLSIPSKAFTSNKVLVMNIGFNKPGKMPYHWIYFPEKKYIFYRVGFYNNILKEDKLSLYIEVGFKKEAKIDIQSVKGRIIKDLKKAGIINEDFKMVSHNFVIMKPAYAHITKKSEEKVIKLKKEFEKIGIYLLGRYSEWIYCAIEDNLIHAKKLAEKLENEINNKR